MGGGRETMLVSRVIMKDGVGGDYDPITVKMRGGWENYACIASLLARYYASIARQKTMLELQRIWEVGKRLCSYRRCLWEVGVTV